MTGYGRGEHAQKGFKLTVELSSVNRRQSEISVTLPRELEVLEAQIRDVVNRAVSRGRMTVRVSVHAASGKSSGSQVRADVELAKAYLREFHRLARELKLNEPVTLDHLIRSPGVLHTVGEISEAEDVWPPVEKALKQALSKLIEMRAREGNHLAADLNKRMSIIRKAVARVKKQAPQVARRYKETLRQRIKNSGLELPAPEDERLLKEVVFFADRSDISEEITRLESHFKQFSDCLKTDEPVGRTLDFLAQEMNREINTVGSKANDALISREVVIVKAELERFREQVQNVE